MPMRAFVRDVFEPTRYNVATAAAVAGLLLVAYVVYPHRIVQYATWLVVFTIWMVWFVYAGVDYFYDLGS
jgi:hypothetical protein